MSVRSRRYGQRDITAISLLFNFSTAERRPPGSDSVRCVEPVNLRHGVRVERRSTRHGWVWRWSPRLTSRLVPAPSGPPSVALVCICRTNSPERPSRRRRARRVSVAECARYPSGTPAPCRVSERLLKVVVLRSDVRNAVPTGACVAHSLPQYCLPYGGRPSVAIHHCVEPDVESTTRWPAVRGDRRDGDTPFRWVPVVPTAPFSRRVPSRFSPSRGGRRRLPRRDRSTSRPPTTPNVERGSCVIVQLLDEFGFE